MCGLVNIAAVLLDRAFIHVAISPLIKLLPIECFALCPNGHFADERPDGSVKFRTAHGKIGRCILGTNQPWHEVAHCALAFVSRGGVTVETF